MLWTIFVILLVLWLLGVVTSYTLGGFIHVLLIVVVLVCPMLCFGRTESARGCAGEGLPGGWQVGADVVTSTGCEACCCGDQRPPSNKPPQPNRDHAPSQTPAPRPCLCQGAVVAIELRSADLDAEFASFQLTSPTQEPASLVSPAARLGTARHFPPGSTGRASWRRRRCRASVPAIATR